MSFIKSLYTSLSAEEEREVSSAIAVLNKNFGEASTLRIIEGLFKLGSVRVLERLRAADTSATHGESSRRQLDFISPQTGTATFESSMASTFSGAGADTNQAMSDARMRPGTVMACKCYRKTPYKTARGLREHLVLKHGLAPLEAEVTANLTYHESSRDSNQAQIGSNRELTPTAADVHELKENGGQSQQSDWDAYLANQGLYQLQMVLDKEPNPDLAGVYETESDECQTDSFGF